MPLVANTHLPSFQRLRERGTAVLTLEQARRQDNRELHIGLLNLMPDTALTATERQFMHLVGSTNLPIHFYLYPFTIPEQDRGGRAQAHIDDHYFNFSALKEEGLDALIVTGANIVEPELEQVLIWKPLIKIADWANAHVASSIYSCLSAHAMLKHQYRIPRQLLSQKQWGVYRHNVCHPEHPLLSNLPAEFDTPHSRWNTITKLQLEQAGLPVLAESEDAGVHIAVSPDQFQNIYFQGHPEYDADSLLKEYRREILRYLNGDRAFEPPHPENYLPADAADIANRYLRQSKATLKKLGDLPDFPDRELAQFTENTWSNVGELFFENWLRLVDQLSNSDRNLRFRDGIDPEDPLGLNLRDEA
jgi:homoserine O-succinyltransferase/O-acetyltransferase